VLLPNFRDARLHVAAVIVSIHVLGQVVFDFRVSVPQILAAIIACAVFEVVAQFATRRVIAWPASAMLTGSGVALILRDAGMEAGEHWSFHHWWLFALIATGSLATKYVIRWRGSHVFNPSNVGLVVAFLLLGSDRIEPLDFWWAPLGVPMAGAYLVIIVGGVLITRRVGLLEMATAFWATLGASLGALALAGHCMVTSWSLQPVCDARFWWTVMSSPETMIFLYFMITDPRTVPTGRRGRVAFGVGVGVASALFMAPWGTEFGAKVGLLSGLVAVCAARPAAVWLSERIGERPTRRHLAGWVRVPSIAAGAAAVLAVVALAGAPARVATSQLDELSGADPRNIVPVVDTAGLPEVTANDRVFDLMGADVDLVAVATELVRILEVEAIAVAARDHELLAGVDHGVRLDELDQRIDAADEDGAIVTESYDFASMHLDVIRGEGQGNLSIGVIATGTLTEHLTQGDGTSSEIATAPFERTFAMRPGGDGRWFLVAVTTAER
jgi:Na+-translocating ferredoxin:NAD+ oxidoreductase RnfD subunit